MLKFIKKLNPYYHRAYISELLALRSRQGPYRFSVRNWRGITDIDLAVRVLNTEYFRGEVKPVALPVEELKSILVLAPHQDDEAIGSGGSLLLASKAGARLDIVYVTDGDQRKANQPPDLPEVRASEARKVCSRLGATEHQLGISNLAPHPTFEDIDRLASIIRSIKPQVVMAPWLLDWPAKHRMVNHLLWLSRKRNNLPDFEVWGYQVHNTPFVNGYVDITEVAEEKRRLLECYASQNRYRRYDHIAMGLAAWNAHMLESASDPRYVEVFFALPASEFYELAESFYFSDLRATYRGDEDVFPGMIEAHKSVTKITAGRRLFKFRRNERKVIKNSLPESSQ